MKQKARIKFKRKNHIFKYVVTDGNEAGSLTEHQ